jgi:DNA-binding NarL/FixJ family response regulator
VDLVPLRDPGGLDAAIAQALQLGERATQTPQDRVAEFLEGRRPLLVLDNFEHLLPAATGGVDHAGPHGGERASPLLSKREQAVLRLIADGLPNKQIATAMSIGERTVKSHVASAMNKLGVDNRAHAAVAAIRRGLL